MPRAPAAPLACLLLTAPWLAAQPGDDPAVLATRARQARFQSAAVEFAITEVVPKGATVPTEDTTLESTNRLALDGTRVRLEHNHPVFHMSRGAVRRPSVSYFNGEIARVFYPSGLDADGQPSGIIESAPRQTAAGDAMLFPIVFFCRGLDRAVCPHPLDAFRPTGATLPVNGVECVEYAHSLAPDRVIRLWLVPARGHVLGRYHTQSRGKLTEQTDVAYRLDDSLGWVPEAWTTTRYGADGGVTRTVRGRITALQTGVAFEAGHFDVTFPEGTIVADQRDGKHYRVKADGSMRELTVTGQEVPGRTAFQPGTPWLRRNRRLLIVAGVVVVVLVTVYVVKRGGRRRA